MKTLNIKGITSSYNVYIGTDIIDTIKRYMDAYDNILLLTNKTIGKLYINKIKKYIPKNKYYSFEIADGENYKNMDTSMDIYSFMLNNNFSRNSLIICLGGGVICDLGGFIASTFMRGISFIQIPTSLLSQVDASIGGKVAINHPLGKNIIGCFKNPIAVIIDTQFLKTLPRKQIQSGMGEVIKHSIISETDEYFNFLIENHTDILKLKSEIIKEMIYKSCIIKKFYVENDEFEKGKRAILNLGHTYAHALETLFNYRYISHGEAVCKGIIFELFISKELGFLSSSYIKKIKNLFDIYKIDSTPIHIVDDRLIDVMRKDKKNIKNEIKFILTKDSNFINSSVNIDIILKINRFFKNRTLKAVIDIGTNSCRIFVAEIEKQDDKIKIIKPLYKDLVISRLGENLNQTGLLGKNAINRTYTIINQFNTQTKHMGVSEIIAFATSATREAVNGNIFVQGIKNEFNIETIVIPGEIEAKLSFNANSIIYLEKIATIDIGGGSTEITMGTYSNIEFIKSFPIGVIKLTEMFFKNDNYTDESILSATNYLKGFFKTLTKLQNKHFKIIGVAGTVTTNISVIKKMDVFEESKINGTILTIFDLKENLSLFLSMGLNERKKIIGLEKNRADLIISGNLILLTILELLNKKNIIVSTIDNLEGGMVLNI